MKKCIKCKENKNLCEFHKDSSRKNGMKENCIDCRKVETSTYYKNNKIKVRLSNRLWSVHNPTKHNLHKAKWKKDNPEKVKNIDKLYRKNNSEKIKTASKIFTLNNPGKSNAQTAKRRSKKLNATPKWLIKEQLKEIRQFYIIAKELQWLSEEPLHVDHIIPLQGKNVSGLHVPWNLQILPRKMNISKGNR